AEDGIRDYKVTGVQTCALPIFKRLHNRRSTNVCIGGDEPIENAADGRVFFQMVKAVRICANCWQDIVTDDDSDLEAIEVRRPEEIGRASCRERGEVGGVGVALT